MPPEVGEHQGHTGVIAETAIQELPVPRTPNYVLRVPDFQQLSTGETRAGAKLSGPSVSEM